MPGLRRLSPENGKFYLYVPLNNNTGAKIGVCVSTNPAGPFHGPDREGAGPKRKHGHRTDGVR